MRGKLAEKLNSEFTRIYAELNPPQRKRKVGRPKGSKNKKTSTKSRTSKSSSVEVKALSAQVEQLTDLVAKLVALQTNKTDNIISDLSNSSAELRKDMSDSEVAGIVTKRVDAKNPNLSGNIVTNL